jgi:hypothetical protein
MDTVALAKALVGEDLPEEDAALVVETALEGLRAMADKSNFSKGCRCRDFVSGRSQTIDDWLACYSGRQDADAEPLPGNILRLENGSYRATVSRNGRWLTETFRTREAAVSWLRQQARKDFAAAAAADAVYPGLVAGGWLPS